MFDNLFVINDPVVNYFNESFVNIFEI